MLLSTVQSHIRAAILDIFHTNYAELSLQESDIVIEKPREMEHGDYASNIAMRYAKQLKKSPLELAESLAEAIKQNQQLNELFDSITALAPGFINFRFSASFLQQQLLSAEEDRKALQAFGKKEKFLVEYPSTNVAKELHIGHLRSSVIGDSAARILEFLGFIVITDNHLGDWGTQFGMVLYAYKHWGNKDEISKNPLKQLIALYVDMNAKCEADPKMRDEAKLTFKQLEDGDPELRKYWKWMVEVTIEAQGKIFTEMGLRPFDYVLGESFYEGEPMQKELDLALKLGIAETLENDAVGINLHDEKLDDAILRKSDGASTYLMRDLATERYRLETLKVKNIALFVDKRQTHHFQQLFSVCKKLGMDVSNSKHYSFGEMRLPEGKLSTRKGNVIALEDLLEETKEKARQLIMEKGVNVENIDIASKVIGVGAVKYFDLSQNRSSDIVFSWDKVLDFQGNTSVYAQYTYARLGSLQEKSGVKDFSHADFTLLAEPEMQILKHWIFFEEAVLGAYRNFEPHFIAQYIFEMCNRVNSYYQNIRINDGSDENLKKARIAFLMQMRETLKIALSLLGVGVLERM